MTILKYLARLPHSSFFCAVLFFGASVQAAASGEGGGYSGGGGDRTRSFEDSSAWFYGSGKRIRTCAVVASGFGKTEGELWEVVQTAFGTWGAYLDRKKALLNMAPIHLTTQIERMTTCDGSEDLKLYFGMSDAAVNEGRKHFINPVAFAHRTSYDPQKMWGKGLIWLASDKSLSENYPAWNNGNSVLGILLHEVGHILGCDHVPGTIMDEGISGMLGDFGNPNMRAQIDITRELYHCPDCAFDWRGDASPQNSAGSYNSSKKLVTVILGREIDDLGETRLIKPAGGEAYVLELSQYRGSVLGRFPIRVTGNTPMEGAQVFRHAFGPWKSSITNIIYGSLTTADGQPIPVVLEMNTIDSTAGFPAFGRLLTVYGMLGGERAELARFRIEIPPFSL